MLTLYSGSGSGKFDIDYYSPFEANEEVLKNACKLLAARNENLAAQILASNEFGIFPATNDFNDAFYVLSMAKPIQEYEKWRKLKESGSDHRQSYKNAFSTIASVINEMNLRDGYDEMLYIRFIICTLDMNYQVEETEDWRADFLSATSQETNQGLFDFPDSNKYTKYGLNFRSKTEIKIFEALIKNDLFVLPLPVAVLGNVRKKREPDFVVAYRGKVGVLEIHGEQWHPPETNAKESARRREMRALGIAVYEVFDATRCWNDPHGVVNDFLKSFEI